MNFFHSISANQPRDYDYTLSSSYPNLVAAYSLRQVYSTYSGYAINVYNGSTYADIGFVNQSLDLTALANHCGSNNGYIRYWYDQSSNSNTMSQSTFSAMPKIYDGASQSVVLENFRPAIQFDGINDILQASSVLISGTGARSIFVVAKTTSVSPPSTIISLQSSPAPVNGGEHYAFTPEVAIRVNGNEVFSNNPMTIQTVGSLHLPASSNVTDHEYYGNGGNALSVSSAGVVINTKNEGQTEIGGWTYSEVQGAWSYFSGVIQEIILYSSDQDGLGNRSPIESNINTYYSIY